MDLPEQSQLTLWQSYCDKKMECEEWKSLFKKTLGRLEYAHSTSEQYYDYKGVKRFIGEMQKLLNDEGK